MLSELYIRNFTVIDELRLELAPGFNVLTGETGAGKSILIDALNVVLGGRWQEEQLRTGAHEAVVEAAFDISRCPEVIQLLADEGIPQAPDEYLVLRRHLLKDGKSKAYINGRFSSAATLKALGERFVDIHGQGQTFSLLSPRKQLHLLDMYAGLAEEVKVFKTLYEKRQRLRKELTDLTLHEQGKVQRLDILEYQRKEIDAARLREGEEEELLAERSVLVNFEKLYHAVEGAYQTLYAEEGAVLERLASIRGKLGEAGRIDPRLGEPLRSLEAAGIDLEEAAAFLRDYREKLQFDPERLEAVEGRLHEIGKLKRKYGASVKEILRYRQTLEEELAALELSEERIQALSKEVEAVEEELHIRAEALSWKRREAARKLEQEITAQLKGLGMPRAVFQILLLAGELGPTGKDQGEFLFSSNLGEEPKPLRTIASGGELSRTMLALKTVLASADEIPTLIFDEIDAGVGGGMAETVGRKLFAISVGRQVLCITHLPQIASFADAHFRVEKRSINHRTEVTLKRLQEGERVEELARMLGGSKEQPIPLQHAKELLARAQRLKQGGQGPG